jgi:hypothetical protein
MSKKVKVAKSGRVHVYKSAELPCEKGSDWKLCLQLVRFPGDYDAYRLMNRMPNGGLRSARGQTGLPSRKLVNELWDMADAEGWGSFDLSLGKKLAVKVRKVQEEFEVV